MTNLQAQKIKHLCIAYEALSRCVDAKEFSNRVSSLLGQELNKAEGETLTQSYLHTSQTQDDEIPF